MRWIEGFEPHRNEMIFERSSPSCYSCEPFAALVGQSRGGIVLAGFAGESSCLSTLIDASVHREWITNMGQRAALERTAHLLCELFVRLRKVGRTDNMSFRLPLTQAGLGDVLGLSLVHVNRVVQALRTQGLVSLEGRIVTVLDWDRLQEVAEFEPSYLHLDTEPV